MRRFISLSLFAVLVCFFLSFLGLSQPLTLGEIAEEIAADAGEVLSVVEGDPERVIFVFEERHDSKLFQVEIAIMLNRLYEDYDMRHIGLEGLMTAEGTLDCSWAHRSSPYKPDQPITGHEDVIVQTLQDGEISAVEMMGLIYGDVIVHGIDNAELYGVSVPEEAWIAPYDYLYSIAFATMSEVMFTAWQALTDLGKDQEAFEFAVSTNPFTAERYARLSDPAQLMSVEETLRMYDELRAKAVELDANLHPDAEPNMELLEAFLEAVHQRSEAFAANMLDLAAAYPGVPVAMNIGALHTARVAELFTDAGVSFIVLRSQAQSEGSTAGLLSPEAYRRKEQGLSVAPDWALGALLDGRRKPEPAATKAWYKAQVVIRELAQSFAETAAEMTKEGHSPEKIEKRFEADLSEEWWDPTWDPTNTMHKLLKCYGITDVTISGVYPDPKGQAAPTGKFLFDYKDPLTGKETLRIWVSACLLPSKLSKYQIIANLEKRLSQAKEELFQEEIPLQEKTEPNTEPPPQKACSNTLISIRTSG